MPRDGQTIPDGTVILPDLLALPAPPWPGRDASCTATERLRADLSVDGRITGALLEANQTAAHGLAWLATYVESLRQMHAWAERLNGAGKFGEVEQLILQIGLGEYLWQIYGGIPMSQGEILRRRTSA
jgi:(2S)-methylsuccinyl-CoA dehydrogenase